MGSNRPGIEFATIEDPSHELQETLWQHLRDFSNKQVNDPALSGNRFFAITAQINGTLAGAAMALVYFRGMNLQYLWVHEDHRGLDLGTEFLRRIEVEARSTDCSVIYGHTFAFQAPGFYLKQGYEVFGEIPDFPPGYTCFFMRKYLPPGAVKS